MNQPEKAYCLSCGELVPLEKVDLGIEGEELFRCAQCGAYLGTRKSLEKISQELKPEEFPSLDTASLPEPELKSIADFHSESSIVSEGPIPIFPKESQPAHSFPTQMEEKILLDEDQPGPVPAKFETIILAEDSELVALILQEMIRIKNLAQRVISCKNGFEFLISYLKNRSENIHPGLVILDVIMPVLNGISAAVAIRSWEKALNLAPIPILFFTSKRCDDTFKRVLQHTSPSMYINKGVSDSASKLEVRIEKIIKQLLKEEF